MPDQPGEYRGVQQGATGKGSRMRDLLEQERRQREEKQHRDERVQERIRQSPTRRFMVSVFFVLYVTLGIQFMLKAVGMGHLVAPVAGALSIGTWPFLWYKPNPPDLTLGPLTLSKIHMLALLVYAVLNVFLINLHRAILEERVQVS